MKLLPLILLAALAGTVHAQWRTTSYSLKPGWTSMYLNGDASYLTPDQHFAAHPDVVEVWRWNPNPSQVQFTTDPSRPTQGTPEWSVWRRGQPQYSDLSVMTGQTSYLIKLRDGAAAQLLPLKQRVEPPRLNWVRTGANLLGFPTKLNGAAFPTFSSYFATFPSALATPNKVFRYNGGLLDANNPVRVFSPSTERVDSTQAYWFETKTVGDFIGPLAIEISDPTGLNFGAAGSEVTLTIRNRTAVTQTLTFAPVNSEPAPAGLPAITGPVALTRRIYNTATAQYDDTALTAPFSSTVAAGGTVSLLFGVNRTAMAGPPGSLFASLLRITDAANMMDVHLPASAGAASLAGLWVGDAELTQVESKTPGSTGTATARSFPLRYIVQVDDAGRATLLSQAYIGTLASNPDVRGVTTSEAALKQDQLGSAMRLTAAHMPLSRAVTAAGGFGAGATLTGIINLPFNDPTNPFVHQYHPDHDNRDARFNPVQNGAESWTVNRTVTFSFSASAPAGLSSSWGSRALAGTYQEIITGIHRQPITLGGSFTLRRVSDSSTLVRAGGTGSDPPYTNTFDSALGAATLRGDAVWNNGSVRLTDTAPGQMGSVVLDGITAGPSLNGFTARFRLTLGPTTTGVPADGVSFAVGDLGDAAWGESGPSTTRHITVSFDTYDNGGTGSIGVHLWVNGTRVATNPINPYTNGVSVPVEVSHDAGGGVTVKFNGATLFSNAAAPGFAYQDGDRFGFGGRTGGANEQALIDDVEIIPR